jgi:hypothetical protein
VVSEYSTRTPRWGFNGLGEFVYGTRYARVLANGTKETWAQTVERVVNGTFNLQVRGWPTHAQEWNHSFTTVTSCRSGISN